MSDKKLQFGINNTSDEWFKAKIMSANKKMKFSEYVSLRKNTAMEVDPGINEHSSLTELRLGR